MEINLYLLLSLLIALLVISYLLGKLHRVRGQLFLIRDALNDIKAGNLNRRVLARESDLTKQICYDINEIAMSSQSRLIQQKQSEQAYKRLMTSLSHDVKTPLASLVGYLEAVESKMVTGAEKEEYIRVAMEKAYHLKDFVTALFEWVKLDAGEQIFHFEVCDLNELSRDIMADWVPLLENHDLSYEIEIPETEYMTRVDSTAYTRILNNLLQNILTHSDASKVFLTVTETEQQAKIVVADNGNGIAASDLPHIFERMYQCDHSRSAKGNGLGLSIAKELVSILPVCLTLIYTFLGFILLMVNMYLHPLSSMTAIVMYDIPGVVFDQPLNIPAAFLCIGVWAAASAVLANVALVRRK